MKFVRIIRVEHLEAMKLALHFNDGTYREIDFDLISDGGILKKLKDPFFFKNFSIERNGRTIKWENGIDFCADSLYGKS